MKLVSLLRGLLFDDTRLALTLLASLLLAGIFSYFDCPRIAAFVIWGGLVLSLFISIEHQLHSKMKTIKNP